MTEAPDYLERLIAWVKQHVVWHDEQPGDLEVRCSEIEAGWEVHLRPLDNTPATFMVSLISGAFTDPLITGSYCPDAVQVSGQYGAVEVYLVFHFSRPACDPSTN